MSRSRRSSAPAEALARHLPMALVLALVCWSGATPAAAEPSPPYCLPGQTPALDAHFTSLRALLGETIGQPVECGHPELATGDIHQLSTAGLLYYRARTGAASFTDGFTHWALTGGNLVIWPGDDPDPADSSVELPAEPAPVVGAPTSARPDDGTTSPGLAP